MYKILTSTDDKYKSGYVRNQGNRDSHIKDDHAAAGRGHMYMIVKMRDLFGFVDDLQKIIRELGFNLRFKRKNNDRALLRVNDGSAGTVANVGTKNIRNVSWCVPGIEPSNDNRIIVQERLNKRLILILVIMKERHSIRMYPMLLTSYLILVWKVALKDLNK